MTLRLRPEQQARLARDNVGRALAEDFGAAFGGAVFDNVRGQVEYGPVGRRGRLLLDASGRITQNVTPLGRATSYGWGPGGLTQIRTPSGATATFSCDQAGFPASAQRHDGVTEQFTYSDVGDLLRYQLGDGSSLRFDYDTQRRLTRVVERSGNERRWEYDDEGRLVRIIDPLGHTTQLDYTNWTLPSRITHDGVVEDLGYRGSTTERRIGGVPHSTITHDADARVIATAYADDIAARFSYDDKGRVVAGTLGDVTTQFTYDDVSGQVCVTEAAGRAVKLEYQNGAVSRVELPDGRSVSYEYDADGRLTSAVDWSGSTQYFSYEAGDLPVRRELPSRLVERHSYDATNQLRYVEVASPHARLWLDSFERDALDRVTVRENNRDGRKVFTYEGDGQLSVVSDAAGGTLESFGYDANGNRIYAPGQLVQHDLGGRAVLDGTNEYGYDARGNRSFKRSASDTTQYHFDFRNHLVAVTHADGSKTEYTYDAFSRRMSKRHGDLLVEYVWSGHQLVQELVTDGDERYSREYMYFPGEHRPLAMCARGRMYYYHLDHIGTPQFLTDAAGAVVWSARYSSYGVANVDVGTIDQPLRFQGQYFDTETGLHYNRARYYDPALGSYLSLDSGLPPGSANAYRYVAGDPINQTDPLGLFGESWPGWVKTTVSVAASVAVVGVAALLLPAELPVLAAIGATMAVGALAGAVGFGLDAAMTKGGCVWCAMKEGAVIGAIGALPFVAALVCAGPAAIGLGLVAGLGGAAGAVSYASDCLLYGKPWNTTDFLVTVAVSAATAGLFKLAGGKIASLRAGRSAPEASSAETTTEAGNASDSPNAGDRDTVPTIREAPPRPPNEVPPPKTGDPYTDQTVEMTDYGKRFDGRNPVKIFTPEELEARRVIATDDGRLVLAQSGEPVTGNKIFVMDKSGNVFVDEPAVGKIHHSSLAGGENPAGAGHLLADNGRLLSLDDDSGHFGENLKPGSPDTVKNELASQGVDVSQTHTSSHGDVGPNPPLALTPVDQSAPMPTTSPPKVKGPFTAGQTVPSNDNDGAEGAGPT